MQVNVVLPFAGKPAFLTREAVVRVGITVEQAGFYSGLVTDHPCPPQAWLDAGGDPAHGPMVLLALVAMATTRLRLQTSILVLPYRNPFGVARDAATLDRFSSGRLTLGVGAGYLEDEYQALGADFTKRNAVMDEYIRALRLALTGEPFTFEGNGFRAGQNCINPGPVQKPIPIYAGGNSRRAIRRAVELCDGWNPFFTGHGDYTASDTRTSDIASDKDLLSALDYLREYSEQCGRDKPPLVELGGVNSPFEVISSQQLFDRLCHYRELGIGIASILVRGDTVEEWCDNAAGIGEEVVARL